jgi:hypothetical protein
LFNVANLREKLGDSHAVNLYEFWFDENAWRQADIALSEACLNGLRQLCDDLEIEIDWTSRPEGYYWDKAVVAWKKKVVIPRIMEWVNE